MATGSVKPTARQVAAHYQRRRQLALLVERLEAIERTPARNEEQARLKQEAIRELVEQVG